MIGSMEGAKQNRRDEVWRKIRKKKYWREYKLVKNKHLRRRDEGHKCEKDVTDKCGNLPKSFDRYKNKMKHRNSTVQLRNENGTHHEPKKMSEFLNLSFQMVLTNGSL